jgi:hypothetical protein
VGSSRAVTRLSSETNPQQDARARAWAYVFDCYRKKEATRPGGPNDAERSLDAGARSIIQESN